MWRHCLKCSCTLALKSLWGLKFHPSAHFLGLESHRASLQRCSSPGAHWQREAWAEPSGLVVHLAQAPTVEEEGSDEQCMICRQILQQPVEKAGYTAWWSKLIMLQLVWQWLVSRMRSYIVPKLLEQLCKGCMEDNLGMPEYKDNFWGWRQHPILDLRVLL